MCRLVRLVQDGCLYYEEYIFFKCFSPKNLDSRSLFHKILVRIVDSEGPDQTAP